jgi:tryptophan 2,3-dioxygenase
MGLSYAAYLKLAELLSLQEPTSEGPEHDELLFIVVHQIHELWFKQILHELKLLQLAMENGHAPIVTRTLRRILAIVTALVAEIDILETFTPTSFASFRERIEAISGLHSVQFREIEFVLGLRRRAVIEAAPEGSRMRVRLERLLARPSVYDSFLRYLALLGYPIPPEILNRDFARPNQASPAVQESLIEVYRHDPGAWQICELLVDLDQRLQEWRYRHAVMVERTAGANAGAGGSGGPTYLQSTIGRPLFPDLWAIRDAL